MPPLVSSGEGTGESEVTVRESYRGGLSMAAMRDHETLISSNGGGGRDDWAVVSWISCVPLRGRERIATQK